MPRPTPFHSRTSVLCEGQAWQNWSGYLSANMYELDHIHEYNAVRMACGLFDISPLFKYRVSGRDSLALLNRMVTRDVSKCRVGQVMYTAWCDDEGKVIDDGTVARLSDDTWRVTAAIPTHAWLEDNALGLEVAIEDTSEAFGAVAVQGPTSRALLQKLTGANLDDLRYFRLVEDKVAGVPAQISRTGYTGDLGYELFVDPEGAGKLWDALMETGNGYGVLPAGNMALEMVRIEAGLLLIEVDFISANKTMFAVQRTSPYDLGLGWAVKLDKEYFVGQEALRREKQKGSTWATVGLELDIAAMEQVYARYEMPLHLPYAAWTGEVPIYADGERRDHIGKATSGTWSPTLKKYVAIARVEPKHGGLGCRLFIEETVEGRRFAIPARVVKMPFFDPPRKKD